MLFQLFLPNLWTFTSPSKGGPFDLFVAGTSPPGWKLVFGKKRAPDKVDITRVKIANTVHFRPHPKRPTQLFWVNETGRAAELWITPEFPEVPQCAILFSMTIKVDGRMPLSHNIVFDKWEPVRPSQGPVQDLDVWDALLADEHLV